MSALVIDQEDVVVAKLFKKFPDNGMITLMHRTVFAPVTG